MYFYRSYDEYRGNSSKDCCHRFTAVIGKRIVCLDCNEEIGEIDPDEIEVSFRDLFK